MKCVLREDLDCPIADVYGACFFCTRPDYSNAVPEVPVLETEPVYSEVKNE